MYYKHESKSDEIKFKGSIVNLSLYKINNELNSNTNIYQTVF